MIEGYEGGVKYTKTEEDVEVYCGYHAPILPHA